MKTTSRPAKRGWVNLAIAAAVVVVAMGLAAGLFLGLRLLRGQGLGLWRLAHLGRAVLDSRSVVSSGQVEFANIIFLHHSTGHNLIEQGGVRELFTEAGYDFWDHGYTWPGLRRPDGSETGYSYRIPDDNTDRDGLGRIFSQRVYPLPINALSGLLQHDVIISKSCFPASQIDSEEQLQTYKGTYLAMRDVMDQYPDKLFIVMSPPPLNPASTDPQAAARARAFANWLASDAYLAGHPNVAAFDFFDALAESDPAAMDFNMLRADYRDGEDSHPNQTANEIVGPHFAGTVIQTIKAFKLENNLTSTPTSSTMVICWLDSIYHIGRLESTHPPLHRLTPATTTTPCAQSTGETHPIAARLSTVAVMLTAGHCYAEPRRRRRRFCRSFWGCSSSLVWSQDSISPRLRHLLRPLQHCLHTVFIPTFSTTLAGKSQDMVCSSLPLRSGIRLR